MMNQYKIEGGDAKRIVFKTKIIKAQSERAAIILFLNSTDILIEYVDCTLI